MVQQGFALDGYVVEELIGFGGSGEVWRAREELTGETVALKRLRTRGPAATERLRREAGLLQTLAGPHVVGMRRMLVDDDEAVMVMDYADGGDLATILAVRGRLPAPEVVTIVAPIATALAAAHTRDLVHGDLTPANIVFTADGRPLLADFGVARVMGTSADGVEATIEFLDPAVAAGGTPTPASDVFALGAVAFAALAGHSPWGDGPRAERTARAVSGRRPAVRDAVPEIPTAMSEAIEWMLSTDPEDRPDARAAGNAVLRSGPVAPVGLVRTAVPVPPPMTGVVPPLASRPSFFDDDDEDAEDDGHDWTASRRRIVVATAAVLAVLGAAGIGVSLARSGHGPARAIPAAESLPTAAPTTAEAPTTSTPAAPVSHWGAVIERLDALRAKAFDEADPAPLAEVYAPGAGAYATDVATVRSLASRGVRAQGFAATVVSATPAVVTATTATVQVVDQLSGYRLVSATGDVVGQGAPRPPTEFTMQLRNIDGGWRVAAIDPAG
jgi:serine/threonine protein kinase